MFYYIRHCHCDVVLDLRLILVQGLVESLICRMKKKSRVVNSTLYMLLIIC